MATVKGTPGKTVAAYRPLVIAEQPNPWEPERKLTRVVYNPGTRFETKAQAIERAKEAQIRSNNVEFRYPKQNVTLRFLALPVWTVDPAQTSLF